MIPTGVTEIATLIWPGWSELNPNKKRDRATIEDILAAAYRIHNAGYRKAAAPSTDTGSET